jgi:FkbM family methyltransferase
MESYTLPNGLSIKHHSATETLQLYRNIFADGIYLRHGISLPDQALVLDAGANIGMFTLFVMSVCPTACIHAFEPAPRSFQLLKENASAYPQRVKTYHCGLGAEEKQAMFTFLPKVTCGSGFYDGEGIEQRKQMIQAVIMSIPEKRKRFEGELGDELLQYYVDELFKGESVEIAIVPVSKIIDELQLDRVDLFKIDVEGSERDVLMGLDEKDWPKIRQMVLEVHDSPKTLPEIVEQLERHGFQVTAVPEEITGEISGTTMAYATRT